MRRLAWPLLVGLVLLCSACGFHLRGHGSESIANVKTAYIEGINPYASFGRIVSELFEGDGIQLLKSADEAAAVLKLSEPRSRREVLSVDASVHAREYSLVTSLRYQIRRRGDEDFTPPDVLLVRRDLTINPNDLLGSDYEANRLKEEMYQELVQGLLFKLRTLR